MKNPQKHFILSNNSTEQRCHDFLFYNIDQVDLIMVDSKKSIFSVSTIGQFFAS